MKLNHLLPLLTSLLMLASCGTPSQTSNATESTETSSIPEISTDSTQEQEEYVDLYGTHYDPEELTCDRAISEHCGINYDEGPQELKEDFITKIGNLNGTYNLNLPVPVYTLLGYGEEKNIPIFKESLTMILTTVVRCGNAYNPLVKEERKIVSMPKAESEETYKIKYLAFAATGYTYEIFPFRVDFNVDFSSYLDFLKDKTCPSFYCVMNFYSQDDQNYTTPVYSCSSDVFDMTVNTEAEDYPTIKLMKSGYMTY